MHVDAAAAAAVVVVPGATARVNERFGEILADLDSGDRFMERVIRKASRGQDFSPEELISIQAGVYRHTQAMEAFSKLVDSATGCVRRTLEVGG
jgi:hypothetical protein